MKGEGVFEDVDGAVDVVAAAADDDGYYYYCDYQ